VSLSVTPERVASGCPGQKASSDADRRRGCGRDAAGVAADQFIVGRTRIARSRYDLVTVVAPWLYGALATGARIQPYPAERATTVRYGFQEPEPTTLPKRMA